MLNQKERDVYTLRVLATTAASLLVLIATVKLWPVPADDGVDRRIYATQGQEVIQMEEVVQTRMEQRTPPPPAPLPPVVVPDDRIIEEELDLSDVYILTPDPGTDDELREGSDTEGQPTAPALVETGPKPVRIVEPDYPRTAKRRGIKAEVVIEVLINTRGQVQETKVLERYLVDKNDERAPVEEIGYGIEESALAAASKWLYRPARKNGTPVTSYTTCTLSFGVQ